MVENTLLIVVWNSHGRRVHMLRGVHHNTT